MIITFTNAVVAKSSVKIDKKNDKPNLLFIMTDQQRFDAMSCAGNTVLKTPNLDRIAREGVIFKSNYSANPVCVPSRAILLTGRSSENVNVRGNGDYSSKDVPEVPTFDRILKKNGYAAEYYGKWHTPYQFTDCYDPYYSMYPPESIPIPESINDPMTDSPCKDRGNDKDELRYKDGENIQHMSSIYYGMVREIDDKVGEILNKLDELGLAENTLVVFTSDHGEMLGDHGMHSKSIFYEGGAHVPLLMRFPGRIKAGTVVEEPVSTMDVSSTILDYLGMSIPKSVLMDFMT